MPSQREWRERDAARADQKLFDRAAAWLRDDPKRRRVAGLWADRVGHALADLLDALGDDPAGLDAAVRWQARESCRPGNGVSARPDPPSMGATRGLRVFIDDGPRGGEYTRVSAGPDGSPPPRIRLRDPLVPRSNVQEGPTGYMPSGRSVYVLTGRLDDGTPMYRLDRDS
jgi:hypothetical protein